MTRRYFDYVITAAAAGVAALVKDTWFQAPGQKTLSYGASILVGVLVFVLLSSVRYAIERAFGLDPRYGYLGWWIEDVTKGGKHHYSVFEITHDMLADEIRVSGSSYDAATHEQHANWISTATAFPEPNTLHYLHKSVIHGRAGDVSGLTRLNFVKVKGRFYEGTGYLIDNSDPLERIHFGFERLDITVLERIAGKKFLASKADRVKFFDAWLNRNDG